MTIRIIQQILDKAETTGALRDDFASGQFLKLSLAFWLVGQLESLI